MSAAHACPWAPASARPRLSRQALSYVAAPAARGEVVARHEQETTDKVDESIGQGFERFRGYASCVLAADAPLSIRRTEQLRGRRVRTLTAGSSCRHHEIKDRADGDYCRGLVDLSQASQVSLDRAPARREPEHCWFLPQRRSVKAAAPQHLPPRARRRRSPYSTLGRATR